MSTFKINDLVIYYSPDHLKIGKVINLDEQTPPTMGCIQWRHFYYIGDTPPPPPIHFPVERPTAWLSLDRLHLMPMFIQHPNMPREFADIPREDGFKFIVQTSNSHLIPAVVRNTHDMWGVYTVTGKRLHSSYIVGWHPAEAESPVISNAPPGVIVKVTAAAPPSATVAALKLPGKTPRTNEAHIQARIANHGAPDKDWPWCAINAGWNFARTLEEELTAVTAERDRLENLLSCVVDHATGGKLSKTTYAKETYYRAIDDHVTKERDEAFKEGEQSK